MSKNWLLEGARGRCATMRKDLNIICLFVLLFHGPSWPVDAQVAFMAPPRSCCSVLGSVAFMGGDVRTRRKHPKQHRRLLWVPHAILSESAAFSGDHVHGSLWPLGGYSPGGYAPHKSRPSRRGDP